MTTSGEWPAGAVFAVAWCVLFLPIATIAMVMFWRRKEIQPIKARSPVLVLITDAVSRRQTGNRQGVVAVV